MPGREHDHELRARQPRRRSRQDDEDDDDYFDDQPDGIAAIIPYKNPKSLVAYYTGVFSLIPILGLVLGPIALIFGILAIRYRQQRPTAGGMGHAITGIVLGSLTTLGHLAVVIFAVVTILFAR
jgi:hypothetical protein